MDTLIESLQALCAGGDRIRVRDLYRALTTLGDVRARERTLLQSRKHRNRRVAHVRRQITDGSRADKRAGVSHAPQRLNDALNRRQFPRIIAKQLRRVRIQRNRGTTRVILAVRRRFTPAPSRPPTVRPPAPARSRHPPRTERRHPAEPRRRPAPRAWARA